MLPIIGLMGHSRGGEAVVIAARLNTEEGLGHHIGAVISLAPTSQYVYQSPSGAIFDPSLEGLWATPYLVLYGAMDEDVAGGAISTSVPQQTGFALYDRARDAKKTMIFVYGATHNGFIGSNPNFGPKLGQNTDKAQLLKPATQEMIAKSYMMAFFRQHLYGDSRWEGMFRGEWVPSEVQRAEGGKARLYIQHAGNRSDTVVIDDFEGTHTATSWQTSTMQGLVTDDGTLPAIPIERELFVVDLNSPHQTSGLVLQRSDPGDYLRFEIPPANRNLTNLSALSFRITQKVGSAANLSGQAQDLYVILTDGNGNGRSVRVSKFAEIPAPQLREVVAYTKSAMCTVRIPLHVFTIEVLNTTRVDLSNVVSLSFLFGVNASGEVEIDSIEFVR